MIIHSHGHFMTCRANLNTGYFTVWDSLSYNWTEEVIHARRKETLPYRRLIPFVMRHDGVYYQRWETSTLTEFIFTAPPQGQPYTQTDSSWCGVFLLIHPLKEKLDIRHRHNNFIYGHWNDLPYFFYTYIRDRIP